MRQQPYEHLMPTQNVSVQCTTQSAVANLNGNASNNNKINGLSTLLGNASNLSKFGNIFSNIMKNNNNQNNSFSQNLVSQSNGQSSLADIQQPQKINLNTNQLDAPNNNFSQSNASKLEQQNDNYNPQGKQSQQTLSQDTAQTFPSINPQFSLDTLLHPQTKSHASQKAQENKYLQDSRNYVLKQMQLHNDYLSRIPHDN